jgi:hypothetical protein
MKKTGYILVFTHPLKICIFAPFLPSFSKSVTKLSYPYAILWKRWTKTHPTNERSNPV